MKKGKKEDKVKAVMCHELRNKGPVRMKAIAETASVDNDDHDHNDNDDWDVDGNCDSKSEDEALVISAHTEIDDENESDIPSDGQEHI